MTTLEMSKLIGTVQNVSFPLSNGTILVTCKVIDTRRVYDRVDVLVMPLEGSGTGWLDSKRCTPVVPVAVTSAGRFPMEDACDRCGTPVPNGAGYYPDGDVGDRTCAKCAK